MRAGKHCPDPPRRQTMSAHLDNAPPHIVVEPPTEKPPRCQTTSTHLDNVAPRIFTEPPAEQPSRPQTTSETLDNVSPCIVVEPPVELQCVRQQWTLLTLFHRTLSYSPWLSHNHDVRLCLHLWTVFHHVLS